MGNSFGDNLPVLQSKGVSMNEGSKQLQASKIHTDDKQSVLQALQDKMAQGDHLKNSEQLLYQALAKKTGQVTDLHQPKLKEDESDVSEWFNKLPADQKPLVKKETQDFQHKIGNNIPAPPFLNENKAHQQHGDVANSKPNVDDKDSNNDQKTFEQDQRDEERRLFEMFQGDNNHVKDDYKGEDLRGDGNGKLVHDNEEYDDDKDNGDGKDDDDDDYNEKNDDYVYGNQDHKVNPEQQNDALI